MHRQTRQHRHAGFVQEIPLGGGFCECDARGIGAGHQVHRLFPEQGEEHPDLLPQTRRAPRRQSAADDGGIDPADGVGRKTANVVLGNAFGINVGVVVDTHVTRLSLRLGLTREKMPEKIEQDLMALVPQKQWALFSHWLIWHGRRRCFARKPDCADCEIQKFCPQIGVKI